MGMLPEEQRLDRDHGTAVEVHDRLVVDHEVAPVDGVGELGLEVGVSHHVVVHALFERDDRALPGPLRDVHGEVGHVHQGLDAGELV